MDEALDGGIGKALAESESPQRRFTAAEREIVDKCIMAVENRARELRKKGLTTGNFVFGVANSLFVAWSFGAMPQNFWIVYLIEVAILFPLRWKNMVRAVPKEHLYWLDFCWVANFCAVFVIVVLLRHGLSSDIQRVLFGAAWGICNGPLLMAAGALGNALIFHDFDNTASVIIHLLPSLVMFAVGWHSEAVAATWPNFFVEIDLSSLDPWFDVYFPATAGYTIWWVLYTIWLLTVGMKLPAKGWDTIFHDTMRSGNGKTLYKMVGKPMSEYEARKMDNSFTRADAMVYMCIHATLVFASTLVALICLMNQWVHVCLCGVMTLSTIFHAANRYTFYMLQSYGRVIRQGLGIPLNRGGSCLMED
mmetsp:Transcript_98376/g.205171  ORF Transcript_98376/g.205171 Transcript_98376/m.205171 type:complete len:363 (-) Transcript_98376:145-1233(-)|eukprot:CAMPEP_0206497468 /NCGR_PEP_ID=MMETSP0324_2-20121206/50221_1 /ASSEMBLY_ACC=CAM_ASM_000836 /TAXON_ID=2866 /ORGANISM="Crypthecodinium cohnii, Strain Seligo" /LENGTH=362 /DNA_ID=CAMNT_0053983079 /DNA_START=74 /DNA_END=1162 /DNA_ORIENTATION=+